MKQDNSNQNPWAGLSSYEDPAKSEQKLKFCGRDNETKEVTRLIDDNFFMTLYGKSGIGKTSLLNAGVFPALRCEQYTPLSLRLGMTDGTQTFQDIITTAIEGAIEECGGNVRVINVVDEQTDRSAIDYLWNWLARHCFYRADGQTTFPVVVFDQFEEVFRHQESRQKTEVLLTQLHYLIDESHALNDCIVNDEQYYYDFNFRFVLSIREDDLYRLEDSIDNCALTALKRCRYRLRSLSEQSAEAVILVPGEGLIKEDEQKGIVDTIIGIARNKEDKSISTNVLSLICSRIFVDFQKSGADHITPTLVDTFVKGNPFERFYDEATRGFSNKEKSYIEDNLVDSTGRRNSIPESNFLKHVKNGAKLLEGDIRILQRISTSSDGGNYRIELIHDSFCEPLTNLMLKRLSRKKAFSRVLWLVIIILIIIICVLITNLRGTNILLKENLYKIYSEKINKITKDGNPDLSIRLLYEILPVNKDDKSKPWTIEAETALRNAYNCCPTLLDGCIDSYNKKMDFSPDGKYFVTSSTDDEIFLWNSKTRALVKVFMIDKENAVVYSTTFSPNGKKLLTASSDKLIRIWDIDTGKCIKEINDTLWTECANYSPDGKHIVSCGRDGNISVWDVESGEISMSISKGDLKNVNRKCYDYVSYSPDGKTIAAASDSTIILWDAISGKQIETLIGHKGEVMHFEFSNNSKLIVSASASSTYSEENGFEPTSEDNSVKIWDVSSGSCLESLYHPEGVNYVVFSPDDKFVFSASEDGYVRIWDIASKKCIDMIAHERGKSWSRPTPNGMTYSSLENVNSIAISPIGDIFITNSDYHKLRVWKYPSGEPDISSKSRVLTEKDLNFPLYFSDINQDESQIITRSLDSTLYVISENKYILKIKEKKERIIRAFYCNRDQTIVCVCGDGRVLFYDSYTGRYEKEFKIDISKSTNLYTFSPDGNYFVCADSIASVWCINSGSLISQIACKDSITAVEFIASGSKLFVFEKSKCQIWNVHDWTIEKEINMSLDDNSYINALSSKGDMLLTSTYDYSSKNSRAICKIWNTNTKECVNTFLSNCKYLSKAEYVHNSDYLFCMSTNDFENYIIELWDVNSGNNIGCYSEDGLCDAYYIERTNEIAIFTKKGNVRIIPFPTYQLLMDYLEKRINMHPLSEEVLAEYGLDTHNYIGSLLDEFPVLGGWLIIMVTLFLFGGPIGILLFLLKVYLSNRKVFRIVNWLWSFYIVISIFALSFITYIAILIALGVSKDEDQTMILLLVFIFVFVSTIIAYNLLKRKFKKGLKG